MSEAMSEKVPALKIETTGPYTAKVEINGREIRGIAGYSLEHNAGGIPILTLEMVLVDDILFMHKIGEYQTVFKTDDLPEELKRGLYEQLESELEE